MIRILKISNPYLEANFSKIDKVKEILREQFPYVKEKKINHLEELLTDPLKYKYQASLFVTEDLNESVKAFALLLYMPDLHFCFLDYLAVSPDKSSSGIGEAFYERIREEADSLGAIGLFYECLPDDPALCDDQETLLQNRKRLAFYEHLGGRPIVNTLYESRVKPSDDCPPYLVFDGLGKTDSLSRRKARAIVKAILERKYPDYCDEKYNRKVLRSIIDDPVKLRPPRYTRKRHARLSGTNLADNKKIFLVVNDKHIIHHIRERGYVESPVRVKSILKEIEKSGLFRKGQVKEFPDKNILEVHDRIYFNYFKKVCNEIPKGDSVYPYVFPIRHSTRTPKNLSVSAGYFCFDTFTPLNHEAFLAARWGVNCTLSAAAEILSGARSAYALTRPPGHHTEIAAFGGFCYFNNCAIAANYLSKRGKVAILDIDYHHGNGAQQIFFGRKDVLTISIHGHPSFAYPYFSGFKEENGIDDGIGFNHNFPLPEKITWERYEKTLNRALKLINDFNPDYLVIALGLDTAKGDPTGTWDFIYEDFLRVGRLIGAVRLPTLVVQEGGFKNQSLGSNAKAFFMGLHQSLYPNREK